MLCFFFFFGRVPGPSPTPRSYPWGGRGSSLQWEHTALFPDLLNAGSSGGQGLDFNIPTASLKIFVCLNKNRASKAYFWLGSSDRPHNFGFAHDESFSSNFLALAKCLNVKLDFVLGVLKMHFIKYQFLQKRM